MLARIREVVSICALFVVGGVGIAMLRDPIYFGLAPSPPPEIVLQFELTEEEEDVLDPSVRKLWRAIRNHHIEGLPKSDLLEACLHASKVDESKMRHTRTYTFETMHRDVTDEGFCKIFVRTNKYGDVVLAGTSIPCF